MRSILQSVAAGDISPAEAAELIDALPVEDRGGGADDDGTEGRGTPFETAATERLDPADAELPPPPPPPLPEDPPPPPPVDPATADAERLEPESADRVGREWSAHRAPDRHRVTANLTGGPITIVCDPGTTDPTADGPCTVDVDRGEDGYVVEGRLGDDSVVLLPGKVDLALEANGSNFSLTGLDGTLSAELNCGNVVIDGRFSDGMSRIRANAGNIELTLQPGSDVEIISTAPSAFHADGQLEHVGRGRWSLGAGTAKFEIAGNMGLITVAVL